MADCPFDDDITDIANGSDDERHLARQANWETKIVKTLLKHIGACNEINDLMQDKYDNTGRIDLSFSQFIYAHPEFPVYLFCRKIPYVHEATVEQIFKAPHNLKMVKEFLSCADELPVSWGSGCYGVVFEWLHSGGPIKVIHNNIARRYTPHLLLQTCKDAGSSSCCIVENLSDFLKAIKWHQ